jgi:thioredoxin reductase/NAD-dependent dihydropyrimidine dehydrogenase PreA subunit
MTYALLVVVFVLFVLYRHSRKRRKKESAHSAELREAIAKGMTEPPSLHPVIHPTRCIGSGSCVRVCPEEALGIINGKAVLTNASACIGHGACLVACPVDAITLVFGTEKRGIDIPNVKPNFETNVPGIFIAGELGGMGLIRKAAEQGRQAIDTIRSRKAGGDAEFDVVIVGGGPAGLSAGLAAIEHGLSYKLLEQEDSLGGTVYHYPRNKIAMTAPVKLALVGTVKMGEIQKEALLEFWQGVVKKTGLELSLRQRMDNIEVRPDGTFAVHTNAGVHTARAVLLAIGRRGSPRKLDVPGEETSKVVYRLIDAEQYAGRSVVVVGGGDSALEAAIALSEQPGTDVLLSYRSKAFGRVKAKNRERLEAQEQAGRLKVLLESRVLSIERDTVTMEHAGTTRKLPNDVVIVCAGGVLPTALLQTIGIQFETKHGSR